MRFSDKLLALSIVVIWSAVGGGLLVSKAYAERGVVVLEKVVYRDHPLVEEAEKYRGLMEKLLGDRMASPPENIRRSPDERQVSVPLPRPRPVRSHGRTIEDVIALAEAGL